MSSGTQNLVAHFFIMSYNVLTGGKHDTERILLGGVPEMWIPEDADFEKRYCIAEFSGVL